VTGGVASLNHRLLAAKPSVSGSIRAQDRNAAMARPMNRKTPSAWIPYCPGLFQPCTTRMLRALIELLGIPMHPTSPSIPEHLRKAIRNRQVVIVVGAGVSIQATGNAPAASWNGLIKLGIERCTEIDSKRKGRWEQNALSRLDSEFPDEFLGLANEVARVIGGNGQVPGRFGQWLGDTVGKLEPKHPEIIEAIHALTLQLVTTNYDGLLQRAGLPPVTWRDSAKVHHVLRGDIQGVLHLHGHWEQPESVVLDSESYVAVRDDHHPKAVLRALAMSKTLMFVGCGEGLSDPNFSRFRKWLAEVNSANTIPHFRLCRTADHARLAAEHDPRERIELIPYGDHKDLLLLLAGLNPASGTRVPAGIWQHASNGEEHSRAAAPASGDLGATPAISLSIEAAGLHQGGAAAVTGSNPELSLAMQFRYFLCHNSNDKALVREFHASLQANGVRCWFDEVNKLLGQLPLDAIIDGLARSEYCVVFLGQGGQGQWQSWEIKHAVHLAIEKNKKIIVASLPQGPARGSVPEMLRQYDWVDMRAGLLENTLAVFHGMTPNHDSAISIGGGQGVNVLEAARHHAEQASKIEPVVSKPEVPTAEDRRVAEEKLKAVFGDTYQSLKDAVAEGSAIRALLLSHYKITALDPDTQASELLVLFHEEFIGALGSFRLLYDEAKTTDERSDLVNLMQTVLFLSIAPDKAMQWRSMGAEATAFSKGGKPRDAVMIPAAARGNIQTIITAWIRGSRSVKPLDKPAPRLPKALDVPPDQEFREVKRELMNWGKDSSEHVSNPDDRESTEDLEDLARIRAGQGLHISVVIRSPELRAKLNAPESPEYRLLRHLLVFGVDDRASINPQSKEERFDKRVEMLVAELNNAFKLS